MSIFFFDAGQFVQCPKECELPLRVAQAHGAIVEQLIRELLISLGAARSIGLRVNVVCERRGLAQNVSTKLPGKRPVLPVRCSVPLYHPSSRLL